MNMRQTLILVVVFLLGVLTAGAFLGRQAGAASMADSGAPGRYQATCAAEMNTGSVQKVYYIWVTDTATGECWYKSMLGADDAAWKSFGSPVKAK